MAGALGTLAASWTPADELREQLRWIRAASIEPFCVNLVLAFEQRQRLEVALDEGTKVISFSWGIDRTLISQAREAGAFVLVQVGDSAEAPGAVEAGADALIVQGIEAGGHVQAQRTLNELLPEIRSQVDVPLVAAGGISDRESIEAARSAGADAVACGTVFLAAEEADIHPVYLERLIAAEAADTVLTTAFDGGWPDAPHRVLRNETVAAWEAAGKPPHGHRPGEDEPVAFRAGEEVFRYADSQPTRDTTGEIALMAMYAGTSARSVKEAEPAANIVSRLAARS
jgi:NAD(P)H-dependent flavin oxidoreductase YrpB (nitropropane dioxygenase family)